MHLLQVLLRVLEVKTLPHGFCAHAGIQQEKERDDDECRGGSFRAVRSRWNRYGTNPANLCLHILSERLSTSRVLNIPPPPKKKEKRVVLPGHVHPAATFPTHRLLTSSSLPALQSARVCKMWWGMHAGRKHGSGALWGGGAVVANGKNSPN